MDASPGHLVHSLRSALSCHVLMIQISQSDSITLGVC